MDVFAGMKPAEDAVTGIFMAALQACGRPGINKYPFGNPVSVESCHLSMFSKVPYLVADKSDGVRACLLMAHSNGTYCENGPDIGTQLCRSFF